MARLPRIVIPGLPHHVTQRGNRRSRVFFEELDYALYLDLLSDAALKAKTEIWCYCLMPNHVHLIAVPSDEDGLRATFADAHRRYTGYINARLRASTLAIFAASQRANCLKIHEGRKLEGVSRAETLKPKPLTVSCGTRKPLI